jgi:hypothetical protein
VPERHAKTDRRGLEDVVSANVKAPKGRSACVSNMADEVYPSPSLTEARLGTSALKGVLATRIVAEHLLIPYLLEQF